MPEPKLRSRSSRRVFRKTPGGRVSLHHVERRPSKSKCGKCGKELHGIPRKTTNSLKNTPKTLKRPERPYGGVLCSSCMRKKIIENIQK